MIDLVTLRIALTLFVWCAYDFWVWYLLVGSLFILILCWGVCVVRFVYVDCLLFACVVMSCYDLLIVVCWLHSLGWLYVLSEGLLVCVLFAFSVL